MPRGDGDFRVHPENAIHVGRPKESSAFKKLKQRTNPELLAAIAKVGDMTKEEALEFIKLPTAKLLEIGLVKRLFKGDVELVFNRLLGMPKQPIENDGEIIVKVIKSNANKP